jgi:hypothetical protein
MGALVQRLLSINLMCFQFQVLLFQFGPQRAMKSASMEGAAAGESHR